MRPIAPLSSESITQGSIPRALLRLATPMMISALLQNLQSLIDMFWVGRLGPTAVAAVAMGGTVIMLLFPVLMGMSTGTVALVARATGSDRHDEGSRAAAQSLVVAAALAALLAVTGWFASDPVLRLLGASGEVSVLGSVYLRTALLGSFASFSLFMANAALLGAGDSVIPMRVAAVATLSNIALDPLLIFGLGPLPAFGVQGAALATVLAQGLAAAASLRSLAVGGRSGLMIRVSQLRPDRELIGRILRIGIPGSGQMLARSLMNAVMIRIVATCGTAAVAAYGIGFRLHMVVLLPAFALGGAAAIMVGQNLGIGRPDRARRAAWLATGLDMIVMVFAAIVAALHAPAIVGLFSSNPEVVHIGSRYLRIISPFYVLGAAGVVLSRALNGAGDSLTPMLLTVLTLAGLQIPLAVFLARAWQPPTQGIWWAMAIAMAFYGSAIAAWFATGRWERKRV